MKRLSRRKIAQLFLQFYEHESKDVALRALAQLIIMHQRKNELALILNEINSEYFKQTGRLTVDVATAHPPTS